MFSTPGHLDKLHFLFELLANHDEFPKEIELDIFQYLKLLKRDIEDYPTKILETLQNRLGQILTLLLEHLTHYLDNEHILSSLLKHKSNLSYYIEKSQIDKILLEAFPKGESAVQEFIQRKHSQRGFSCLR